MPYAAIALATYQVISGLQQADLINQQAEVGDMISEANQEFMMNDSFEALASGLTEEARYENAVKNVLESQKAELAYRQVDASYGSVADLQAETAVQGLVNGATIRNSAYARSLGMKEDALNLKMQSSLDRSAIAQRSASARNSGILRGVSTAFSAYTADPSSNKPDQGGSEAVNIDLGVENYELGNYGTKF